MTNDGDLVATTPVRRAQDLLASLEELPVAEHAEAFEAVHTALQSALNEIDGL
jgi:hypothetical protein